MIQNNPALVTLGALARRRGLTPMHFSVLQRLQQGQDAWLWFSFDGVHYERYPITLTQPARAVIITGSPYGIPAQYRCRTVQGSTPWLFFESNGELCFTSASLADNEFVLVDVSVRGDRETFHPHTLRVTTNEQCGLQRAAG